MQKSLVRCTSQVRSTGLASSSVRSLVRLAGPNQRCVARPALNSAENTMLGGDFGARNPTPGEVATNFADSGLTHYDTAHIVKPPESIGQFLGLGARRCQDEPAAKEAIVGKQQDLLQQQIPGWKVATSAAGHACVQHEWKAKDAACAEQLATLVRQVAEKEGHPIAVTQTAEVVKAELSTAALSGLTINDFIVAAKINNVRVVDLMPMKKKRYWA